MIQVSYIKGEKLVAFLRRDLYSKLDSFSVLCEYY